MTDHDPDIELRERWQLRARLCSVEAERNALSQTVDKLVRDCRQNAERAKKAHDRIDELVDMNADLVDKLQKLRDWAVKKLNGKERTSVENATKDGERVGT